MEAALRKMFAVATNYFVKELNFRSDDKPVPA